MVLEISDHYLGYKANVETVYNNRVFHQPLLRKRDSESEITQLGEQCDKFEGLRAVLADERYQGQTFYVLLLHPTSTSPNWF